MAGYRRGRGGEAAAGESRGKRVEEAPKRAYQWTMMLGGELDVVYGGDEGRNRVAGEDALKKKRSKMKLDGGHG
jgi:hypothetical protein